VFYYLTILAQKFDKLAFFKMYVVVAFKLT